MKQEKFILQRFHDIHVWVKRKRKDLLNHLMTSIKHIPGLGAYLHGVHARYQEVSWKNKAQYIQSDIESLVPKDNTFILIDEGSFIRKHFSERQSIAFIERDGEYWGPPADDEEAICILEKNRQEGAAFLVVLWPAFWWLDYYKEWSRYIRSRYHCIEQNKRIIVFDLR
jgi:hypothetical protein